MRENYKERFPEWVNDEETEYDLCLTDDIDSLLSCIMLNKIKGYDIKWFYDFDGLYSTDNPLNEYIGVDMDVTNGKAWGNHVIKLSPHDNYNKQMANLNIIYDISRRNYTSKYCGSTLLTIMSYYGITVDNLSEEGKMILLAIDGTYVPFYSRGFQDTGKSWLVNILEYPELYDVIKRHNKNDFVKIVDKYGLHKPIKMVDGKLETGIDLEGISRALNGLEIGIPECEFTKKNSFINGHRHLFDDEKFGMTKTLLKEDIFSLAVTFKHSISYSVQA